MGLKITENIDLPENYKPADIFNNREEESPDTEEIVSNTTKLKMKFQEGVKNIIPGLDIDTILDKMAEKCKPLQQVMKPVLDSMYYIKENKRISLEEKERRITELKERRRQQIEDWKDSQREYVEHIINDIKSDFGEIKFGVENMTAMVPIIISQIAMPTFIGTGSANPARIVIDGISYKHMLQGMVHPLQTAACKLLDNCDRIGFDLPDPILKTVETVATLGDLINSIPG